MKKEWICSICGYVYDGEDILKEDDDFCCPLCDADKKEFKERNIEQEIIEATNEMLEKDKQEAI